MVGPSSSGGNCRRALEHRLGLFVMMLGDFKSAEIVQVVGDSLIVARQAALVDLEGALEQRLRLLIMTAPLAHHREIIEAARDVGVIRAICFFPDRNSARE